MSLCAFDCTMMLYLIGIVNKDREKMCHRSMGKVPWVCHHLFQWLGLGAQ